MDVTQSQTNDMGDWLPPGQTGSGHWNTNRRYGSRLSPGEAILDDG